MPALPISNPPAPPIPTACLKSQQAQRAEGRLGVSQQLPVPCTGTCRIHSSGCYPQVLPEIKHREPPGISGNKGRNAVSVCGLGGNKGSLLHTGSKARRRFPPAGCRQGLAPRRPPDTHFYFQPAAQISLCCFLRPQNRLAAAWSSRALRHGAQASTKDA